MGNEKFVNDGSEYMKSSEENICHLCKYLVSPDNRECEAFKKIPDEIWDQEFIHVEPYQDQENDIVFERA